MKKFFALLLVFAVLLPCISFGEEYSPALEMKMDEFIQKYNAVGSSLSSPLLALKAPDNWSVYRGDNVAWFKADKNSGVIILLLSSDKSSGKLTSAGLDKIQIYGHDADFLSLITVARRCIDLFADSIFSVKMSAYYVTEAITYFYDNNASASGFASYLPIDAEQKYYLKFFKDGSDYYFEICNEV